jgi:hypothetical protein
MIRTDTSVRGFVVTLVTGILAATFIPLGIAFAIIGAVSEPEAFFVLGLIFAFVGMDMATFALIWRARTKRREAEESAARTSRASARVLAADINPYSRVGTLNPLKLEVELGGGRRSRTVYVPPTTSWQPGTAIDVAYAPADPDNFVPVLQSLGA